MSDDVPLATARAFAELAEVARACGEHVDVPAGEAFPEEQYFRALARLAEATVLAVGEARADAEISEHEWQGDPLRMLRDGTARFYAERHNYGAASLEVTPRKAIVRFAVTETFARSSAGPTLVRGFLERSVEIVTHERQPARFAGNTPRVGGRFDTPMFNMVFEFELVD